MCNYFATTFLVLSASSIVKMIFSPSASSAAPSEMPAAFIALINAALQVFFWSAICEALALGLPVLALDRAGPAVLLREGGGFLVPARSRKRTVEEIRAALLGFIARRAPLARASKDGMAAAQKLFGWDSRLQTVEELYARVVRDGQAARVAK